MKVVKIYEDGCYSAMFGVGLSYGLTSSLKDPYELLRNTDLTKHLHDVMVRLAHKGNGENKFLRQMNVCYDIEAPMYFWKQLDTYKVGTCAQSESTMHTLLKQPITQDNFEKPISAELLRLLEELREGKHFVDLVNTLPQGWLQRRMWTANYAVLQNILNQRQNHKLEEWRIFCGEVVRTACHPEFLTHKK